MTTPSVRPLHTHAATIANAHDADLDPSPADLYVEMARFWEAS